MIASWLWLLWICVTPKCPSFLSTTDHDYTLVKKATLFKAHSTTRNLLIRTQLKRNPLGCYVHYFMIKHWDSEDSISHNKLFLRFRRFYKSQQIFHKIVLIDYILLKRKIKNWKRKRFKPCSFVVVANVTFIFHQSLNSSTCWSSLQAWRIISVSNIISQHFPLELVKRMGEVVLNNGLKMPMIGRK